MTQTTLGSNILISLPLHYIGHLAISQALKLDGIGVATGEMCQNRVMFKQFLMSGGMQFCQIDSGRMAGVNEVIGVYLMAKKLNIPVSIMFRLDLQTASIL